MNTIRASVLNQASRCPGYALIAQSQQRDSEHMSEGRRKHKILEGLIKSPDNRPDVMSEDSKWLVPFETFFWGAVGDVDWHWLAAEHAVHTMVGSAIVLTGTIDAMASSNGSIIAIDWKTGACFGLLPMMEDWQMLAYAVMARADEVWRVQVDNQRIEKITFDAEQKREAEALLCAEVRRICESKAFCPGVHCEHCLCKASCAEFLKRSEMFALAPYDGGALVSGEQVARGLVACAAAETFIKRFKEDAKAFVADGGVVESGGKRWAQGEPTTRKEKLSVDEKELQTLLDACDSGNSAPSMSTYFVEWLKRGGYFGEKQVEGAWKWRKAK